MQITLNNAILDSIDTNINEYNDYLFNIKSFFHLKSGQEHYRLLIYLSSLFNDVNIFDIGTNEGASAMSLATNKKNTVYSFDIVNLLPFDFSKKTNIKFNIGNIFSETNYKWLDLMLKSPLIFLDTAHDGTFERLCYQFLIDNKYNGILLLDDIHLNNPMKEFWNDIQTEKYDLTKYGHGCGTGMVIFDNSNEVILK